MLIASILEWLQGKLSLHLKGENYEIDGTLKIQEVFKKCDILIYSNYYRFCFQMKVTGKMNNTKFSFDFDAISEIVLP